MKLFLVRHGETQRNRERRVLGQGSQSLTELGRRQVAGAARALAAEDISALYVSPLRRAIESAGIICAKLRLQAQVADGLAEVDAGELDGLTSEEMRSRYPDFMSQWDKDPGNARLPGGESLAQVQERAWRLVQAIVHGHPEEQVVAVSHNFPIQTLICSVLELPLSSFRHLRVDLGSISVVELDQERSRLVLLNDVCHLADTTDAIES